MTETLLSEELFTTLCSVPTLYLFIFTRGRSERVKPLTAETAHGMYGNAEEQTLHREVGS